MPPVSNFDYLVVALREGRGSSCEGDWQGKGVLQYRRIVCPQCLPAGIASTLPTMPEIWSYPRALPTRIQLHFTEFSFVWPFNCSVGFRPNLRTVLEFSAVAPATIEFVGASTDQQPLGRLRASSIRRIHPVCGGGRFAIH